MEAFAWPPNAAPQVRLSEALELGVPVAWHEAVAIVRVLAVAAQLQSPPIELPALSQILIDTSGDLLATGRESVGHDPVPALLAMLASLLDERTAPGDLVAFTKDSAQQVDQLSINEFLGRLTFFARPDDAAELSNFATRGLAYRESRLRDEALNALARKAREAVPANPPPASAAKSRVSRQIRGWHVAALLLVAAIASGTAWRLSASSGGAAVVMPEPVAELARRVQDELAVGMVTLQQQLGLASEPPQGRDRELAPVRRRASRPSVSEERRPLPAELAYGLMPPAPDARVLPAPAQAPRIGAPAPPPDTTVYSAQDSSVTAPTLARPQMPAERIEGISQERAGELELLVGVDGRVEQARLVPASNRYQDRMMVSAAKTWRFAPATKDGRPVRYRFRIPITW